MTYSTVELNLGTGGRKIATDKIGTDDYEIVKQAFGPENTVTPVADADGNRLPVGGAQIGATNETAPASDTASAGLNGRLQRIAQRITSFIALLPSALTGSGNFKVSLQESNASQAVTGSVTANAGTNLNTSLLALEAGGNLAAIAGKDFATQTTLALIKAKTDNLDVALSTAIVGQASTTLGQNGMLVQGAVAAAPSYSTGQTAPLSLTTNGYLRVAISSGISNPLPVSIAAAAAAIAKAEDAASADADVGVPAMAVRKATPANTSNADGDYEMLQMSAGRLWTSSDLTLAGIAASTGSGASGTGTQRVILATDDPSVAMWLTDDAGFTAGTSKVAPMGFVADEASTDSVNEDDIGAARMTLDRKQIVTVQPHTSGGLSTFMASGSDGSSILTNAAQAIKASAGQMYGYYLYNPEAAVTFVHFYNVAAASVTVGTTNPLFTIAVPAGAAANLMFPHGVVFSNAGWSCAATTTAGGNGAPATGVSAVIWYV